MGPYVEFNIEIPLYDFIETRRVVRSPVLTDEIHFAKLEPTGEGSPFFLHSHCVYANMAASGLPFPLRSVLAFEPGQTNFNFDKTQFEFSIQFDSSFLSETTFLLCRPEWWTFWGFLAWHIVACQFELPRPHFGVVAGNIRRAPLPAVRCRRHSPSRFSPMCSESVELLLDLRLY